MNDFPDMPEDTLHLRLKVLGDGDLEVFCGHNLSEDMPEAEALYYMDLLSGLHMTLSSAVDHLIMQGQMLRTIQEQEEEDELVFEPDEELLKSIADKKIIPFDKKKLN